MRDWSGSWAALVRARAVSCFACRRSRETARTAHLIEEGEEVLDCPACSLPTTDAGVPIGYVGPEGTYRGKVIVLSGR